jgi:NAD(P)-dependent dehydrogenase (short-subunit alcohol dehydrogenase family)
MAEHRIALVTGAGSGIGLASARALAADGWSVVLAGRRRETLEAAAAAIDPDGRRTLAQVTDVGDPAQVDALFAATRARFGRLDLLFNNAGAGHGPTAIEDLDFATWDQVVRVNLTGAFLCLQAAFRLMKAQDPRGGRIINNGSISAHVPRPGAVAYTATKHAITGLTRQAALDGRALDIACGQIDIGNAVTEMTRSMATGMSQANGTIAAEPVMDVERVAEAVVYMAGLPPDANVLFMTVMATRMPFVGRG